MLTIQLPAAEVQSCVMGLCMKKQPKMKGTKAVRVNQTEMFGSLSLCRDWETAVIIAIIYYFGVGALI